MRWTHFSLACWVCCCALIFPAQSQTVTSADKSQRSDPLVNSAWLVKRLDQPNVRLLEIGDRKQYDLGHIGRAVFVDWIQDITDPELPDRYNIAPRQQIEQLLGRLGITKETIIVLYDQLESRLATRMFWTLRYYGHQRVKILDGGKRAWVTAGMTLTTDVPSYDKTIYRIDKQVIASEADCNFIRANLSQPQFVLIDGRPTEQFSGQQPGKVYHTGKTHARRGHLPQAVNIPWQENLTADGRFKSVSELRKLYRQHGVTGNATIVTYCNEGLHAAHPWFVLTELLGYEKVRLYDDSLSEWANTTDKPLVVNAQR